MFQMQSFLLLQNYSQKQLDLTLKMPKKVHNQFTLCILIHVHALYTNFVTTTPPDIVLYHYAGSSPTLHHLTFAV